MDLNPNTLTEPIIKQLVDQHNIRVDQENYEGGQKIKLHTDHSVKKILYRKLDEYVMPAMNICLLYTSPSPRDVEESRMPSSA